MKQIIFIAAFFIGEATLLAHAQSDGLFNKQVSVVQTTLEKQKREIEGLTSKVNRQQITITKQIDLSINLTEKVKSLQIDLNNLNREINTNRSKINTIANDLGTQIQQTGQRAEFRISELGGDVEKNRLYWIIATLITFLLGVLMYLFLGMRIKSSQTDIESQIKTTKKALEEENLKLDNKLIDVLETQLKVQQEESRSHPMTTNEKTDHSLALKVADEIVRMQKNLSKMDEEIKGLKPLVKGIERIQANFASNGYEMVNLINKDYDERMNIDVINFITDGNLTEGRKIITSIIKPQVNYNGVLIQRAQVDVTQN